MMHVARGQPFEEVASHNSPEMTAAAQAWIAVGGAFLTAVVGLLKYFNYRSRRDRIALVGKEFSQVVEALSSDDELKKAAGAILLRRFFDRRSEMGSPRTPYEKEAIGVIAALLRKVEPGDFQKLLADSLAYAPSLRGADLQHCVLTGAYLGVRPGRRVDLSAADLFEADLTGASLKGATAHGTVFYRASLRRTVFEGADLREADFREADLDGAKFAGAELAGAKFQGATNLPDDVSGVTGADGTVPSASDGSRWLGRFRTTRSGAVLR
jgi:hypothetical protein